MASVMASVLTKERLQGFLAAFPRLSIALVGDLFLDRYLELVPDVQELSIETGLEAYQIERVRNSPGALGTVLNNLAALGVGRLLPVTVLGDDGHGYDLGRELRRLPVDERFLVRDPDRLTPTYTKPLRPLPTGERVELNRLDVRTRAPLGPQTQAELAGKIEQAFAQADGVIVLDQIHVPGEGVVNDTTRAQLERLSRAAPEKLVFIDSRTQLDQFAFGTLKSNQHECLAALQHAAENATASPTPSAGRTLAGDRAAVARGAANLSQRTGRPVYCTLGEEGMLVVRTTGEAVHVPAVHVPGPLDIVGAGDSASAGLVAALLAGANDLEAATVGNLVASITIQQLGTTGTATPEQVLARWDAINAAR